MFGTSAIAAALKTKQNDHVKMNFFLAKFCYCLIQWPCVHSHPRKASCVHRREAEPAQARELQQGVTPACGWAAVLLLRAQCWGQFSAVLWSAAQTGVQYTLSKSARDTKLGDTGSLHVERSAQRQLHRPEHWTVHWCSEADLREVPGWIWSSFFSDSVPASLRQSCF